MTGIAAIVARHPNLLVISDEVYKYTVYAEAAEHVAVSHVRKARVATDLLAVHAVTTDRMIVVHAVMIAAHAVSLMMNANR